MDNVEEVDVLSCPMSADKNGVYSCSMDHAQENIVSLPYILRDKNDV